MEVRSLRLIQDLITRVIYVFVIIESVHGKRYKVDFCEQYISKSSCAFSHPDQDIQCSKINYKSCMKLLSISVEFGKTEQVNSMIWASTVQKFQYVPFHVQRYYRVILARLMIYEINVQKQFVKKLQLFPTCIAYQMTYFENIVALHYHYCKTRLKIVFSNEFCNSGNEERFSVSQILFTRQT